MKFADDSCIQGLICERSDEIEYSNQVDWFTDWCDVNKLLLNTDKTKELVIDFRTKKDPIMPIVIKGSTIEQVDLYVYLGVTIDNQLSWDAHALSVISKMNKRMYFLRKLGTFHIDYTIMSLFYTSVIESILTFCIIGWGGNVTIKNKTVINRSIKRASKLTRSTFSDFDILLFSSTSKKINKIENTDHPLASKIKRSVRSGRPLFITARTERYKKSFLPYAVTLLTYNR